MILKIPILIGLSLILFSCTPEDGVDGRDGTNGQDGSDGQNGISIGLVSTDLGNGCRELNFFRDSNNNGVQDGSESTISTFEVCSGLTPNISMVSQEDSSCPNGGKVFTFFNDTNDNGELDSSENILGSESVCNGEDGVDGIDGNAGSGYALFIEQATSSECTNGGFKISVFIDLNSNAEYDSSTESIKNSTVICYPDKDSIEFPDYSELGHTMGAIGVWRLYSVSGRPVAESNRFNIKIYPDELNPNPLSTGANNQTGWLDFGGQTKIAWSYVWGNNVNNVNITTGVFNIDESQIDGITKNVGKPMIWYPSTNSKAEYISWDFDDAPDLEVFPEGLNDAIFFRVQ